MPPASPPRPERLTLLAGAVVGLSIVGDSLLYGVLPLDAAALGLSLPLVGVLLSANRVTRLVVNTPVGLAYERWGAARPFTAAALLGLLTVLIYALAPGFLLFLLARVVWGVAWSGLRLGGFHAVWAGPEALRGRLMGLQSAAISVGAALALLVGGYLRDAWGYRSAFLVMAGVAALAIPLSLLVRWPQHLRQPQERQRLPLRDWLLTLGRRQHWPVLLATLAHIGAMTILAATAALFLTTRITPGQIQALGIGFGAAAGMILAVRWLSDLVMGPALGEISDRVGQPRLAVTLALLAWLGLAAAVFAQGFLSLLFLALVFLAGAGVTVALSAAATSIAAHSPRPQLFLGAYATAFDAGLAIGPILGLTLTPAPLLPALYLLAATLSLAAIALFWRLH